MRVRKIIVGTIVAVVAVGTSISAAGADEAVPTPSATIAPVDPSTTAPVAPDAPDAPAITAPPVAVDSTTVPAVTDDAADVVAELPAAHTDDFGLVGVTWDPGFDATGLEVTVRLRTQGTWDAWEPLDVEIGEGEGGRPGTEPLWVGSADGIAVRVTSPSGLRPAGLRVATIDPGTTPTAATASTAVASAQHLVTPAIAATPVATFDGAPAYTAKPAIISRAAWGAAKNTKCDTPLTGNETRGVVVHHTAGSNSYSAASSASIVRAVQAYHMKARDWCDIGYNFLVDKYGQIFEGRNGGIDKPVRAAHSGNGDVNTYTMGVSMMGTFSTQEPSAALQAAMVRLIGWRLGTTFHPAKGTYKIGGLTLNEIAGHRDVVGTECPGAAAYAWLSRPDGLRDRVAAYMAAYSSPIRTRYLQLGSAFAGPVYTGESTITGGRRLRASKVDIYSSKYGVYYTSGQFRTLYDKLHAYKSTLGLPTSEPARTTKKAVMIQRFSKGTIYKVTRGSHTKSYAMWGSMEDKYRKLKEARSTIGAPRSGETKISKGRYRVRFTHYDLIRARSGKVSVVKR